jgi:hypothetical protein
LRAEIDRLADLIPGLTAVPTTTAVAIARRLLEGVST